MLISRHNDFIVGIIHYSPHNSRLAEYWDGQQTAENILTNMWDRILPCDIPSLIIKIPKLKSYTKLGSDSQVYSKLLNVWITHYLIQFRYQSKSNIVYNILQYVDCCRVVNNY